MFPKKDNFMKGGGGGGNTNLLIFVMMTFPQLMRVTFSPSENVWASAPSNRTRDEYHTSLSPTSAFWTKNLRIIFCLNLYNTLSCQTNKFGDLYQMTDNR